MIFAFGVKTEPKEAAVVAVGFCPAAAVGFCFVAAAGGTFGSLLRKMMSKEELGLPLEPKISIAETECHRCRLGQ